MPRIIIIFFLKVPLKVTDRISDFAFVSAAKSGKSRIKNLFLDSPKGTHHPASRASFCLFLY